MSKEKELLVHALDRLKHINFEDDHLTNDLIQTIQKYLAQPEQEPSSDDFMYNKLKESYDELVESSLKDFQRGYGAALTHAIYVKEPTREPLSDEEIVALWANKSPANEFECVRLVEKAHGIGGGE